MKLFYSPPSPFARMVVIAAHELGVIDRIELVNVSVSPVGDNAAVSAANPLGKIPALVTDQGAGLFDSRVIVDFLDSLGDRRLCPASGERRWTILTEVALACGVSDAALLARYEEALRPEPLRWSEWRAGQMAKVARALDALEASERRADDGVTIADIAVAASLGYLDFRFAEEDWRAGRPRLAAFLDAFSRRPSWTATAPEG